ncbi:hypothetical protein JCM8208_004582 [Rhodotorula glutinis]
MPKQPCSSSPPFSRLATDPPASSTSSIPSQSPPQVDATFKDRLAEVVREACAPTRQAVEQMQNQLQRLETTFRSFERTVREGPRARADVERSYAAAFVQQYAPQRQTLDEDAATMPPLVDEHGTLSFSDGVVVRMTSSGSSHTSSRAPVYDDDEAELSGMPALVGGAASSSSDAKQEINLSRWLESCAWPRETAAVAAAADSKRFSAANSVTESAQSEPKPAQGEQVHGPPVAGPPAAVDLHGLFHGGSSRDLFKSSSSSDDPAAAATTLKVRRLQVKLLRMQLLLAKTQLEQLTEDAEALDDFASFDDDDAERVDSEEEQPDIA